MLFKRFLSITPITSQAAATAIKPKRPPTAFSYYFKQNVKQICEANNVKTVDAMKIAGEKWRSFSESEKQKYFDEVKPLLENYQAQLKEFEKNLPPKRPATSFGLYLKEVSPDRRAQNPGLNQVEIMKLVSNEWKNMDESLKNKYREQFAEQLAVYNKAVEKFKKSA
ncbi:putative high mobility group protein B3-like protein [Kluyveromyces marxianus]|uniref:High mobility group protein B3-like protein n=2 Tax=Kluyveromyces marxianus TaxID=4911 RepID=A0ABX6EVW8_KLUMA|nr:putative high mobility group protein B3-like protein [Kluyveromyces marxianus DMKU3-1042]QGN16443.1 putative high mobility group protein B3-like protein [Kluyveromyces marxianus]BAO40716.1 putative high mobility group protein B3-like protein [Kluyveromyces marxianus DMKU3-1042]BAP72191.1 putative high mobility group protein B3-like protein [Kluyveromyces marxianus]